MAIGVQGFSGLAFSGSRALLGLAWLLEVLGFRLKGFGL